MLSRLVKWLSLPFSFCLLVLCGGLLNIPTMSASTMPCPQGDVVPAPVLVIRHEAGLSEYDRVIVGEGDLAQSQPAALAGTAGGLEVQVKGTKSFFGETSFAPLANPKYRFRFYFDPNGLVMDGDSIQNIAGLYDAKATQKVWVTLRYHSGGYKIRVNLRDDEYTVHHTAWHFISDNEHYIEVLVEYASSQTASDGQASLWIDDNPTQPIADINLYNLDKPTILRLGSNWAIQGQTSGIYYLDEFVLRDDDQQIGPVPDPATPTPTPETGQEICIHLESDLGEFDRVVHDDSDLSQDSHAALAGTMGGMRITIDDDTAIYGTKAFGAHAGAAYRFRFYVDPNGLSMPNTAQITLAQVRGRRNLVVTRLQYIASHGYTVYARYVDDHGTWRSLPATPISNAEHYIEALVEFSSSPSTSDGSVTYWVDDVLAGQHTDLDLYDKYRRPAHVRLGAPWVSRTAIRGTLYLDEFVLRDSDQYIGPANTQRSHPTATPTAAPTRPAPTAVPTRATPGATPTRVGPGTIVVLPSQPQQTIREVGGGNFHHRAQGVRDPVDPVGALNIATLNPRYVRVNMALDDWEPANDNRDPQDLNWSAFREAAYHSAALALMQERATQDATFVASIWDVPDWVVSNPGSIHRRRIRPEMYPEVAESIIAWILHAQREVGVTIDYISINEPDIGVFVSMSAEDYAPLIVETGKRLAEQGLNTRWLLADVSILRTCQEYATTVWSSPEVRPYIGPLACHSYDQRFASDQVMRDLGQFAQARGRELWVTEAQWRANLDPDLYPTWENALKLSIAYSRLLKESQTSTLFYWQMIRNGFSTNNGTRPYPALDMLAQFKREIPAGSQIVATSPNTDSLYSLAARTPSHFALFAINASSQARVVQIIDLPPGTFYHVVSTSNGTLQRAERVNATGNPIYLPLRPESVNVLTTQPSSAN